jgi:hypothetical protein
VQHLKDGAPHGIGARDALQAGLPFVVPGGNAVVAVDHIKTDRQRIHNTLDEGALLGQLTHAFRHFAFEIVQVRIPIDRHGDEVRHLLEQRVVPIVEVLLTVNQQAAHRELSSLHHACVHGEGRCVRVRISGPDECRHLRFHELQRDTVRPQVAAKPVEQDGQAPPRVAGAREGGDVLGQRSHGRVGHREGKGARRQNPSARGTNHRAHPQPSAS